VNVEGSNPFARSNNIKGFLTHPPFWHSFDPVLRLGALKIRASEPAQSCFGLVCSAALADPSSSNSRERVRPKGSLPDSPKMGYEPASPQQREKPIAEVSSGSVTIPIYASPVTIKIEKKLSQNSEANSKSNGDGSERKTYPSFKVVYYEGTQRGTWAELIMTPLQRR